MRICPVKDLQPGMLLGKSLFSESGQLLLRAGFALEREIIQLVVNTGRTALYVMEEGTEDILPDELISEETRSRASSVVTNTMQRVAEAAAQRSVPPDKLKIVIEKAPEFRNVVDVERVSGEIASLIDEIMDSSALILNQTLIKSQTGYNQEHAIDVAMLAILMGRRLLYSRRDLVELGVAAFLHDLGKMAFPDLVRKPQSEYTEDEHFMMREHPVFGHTMFGNSTDRFFMAQAGILYHHERQDGLGYPLGVRGKNVKPYVNGAKPTESMFPLAEIIAVADTYDNLISGRKGKVFSPEAAVSEIVKQARSVYNVEVVRLLVESVSIFPTGSMVHITESSNPALEGCSAAIMRPNPDKPHYPIVVLIRDAKGGRMTPRTVNLSDENYVRLELAH
jgi:HD-GYP domain-containing protein (c-di-GMP phosphodiesterase class II)